MENPVNYSSEITKYFTIYWKIKYIYTSSSKFVMFLERLKSSIEHKMIIKNTTI